MGSIVFQSLWQGTAGDRGVQAHPCRTQNDLVSRRQNMFLDYCNIEVTIFLYFNDCQIHLHVNEKYQDIRGARYYKGNR